MVHPVLHLISPYQALHFSVAGSFDDSRNDSYSFTDAFLESAKTFADNFQGAGGSPIPHPEQLAHSSHPSRKSVTVVGKLVTEQVGKTQPTSLANWLKMKTFKYDLII